MTQDKRFPELVNLACHDIRTPLATVYGFARTLARDDLDEPAARYVAMIEAASQQIGDLLDELALLSRIESGRFEPLLAAVDSLGLAQAAAAELDTGRVEVSGSGVSVLVPEEQVRRGLSQLARAACRHGGIDAVQLVVAGPAITLSPVTRTSGPVLVGQEIRDLGALVAAELIRALGGSLALEDERLRVTLPAA